MTKKELIDQVGELMRQQECSEEAIKGRRPVLARKTKVELEFEIEFRQERMAKKRRKERQKEALKKFNEEGT